MCKNGYGHKSDNDIYVFLHPDAEMASLAILANDVILESLGTATWLQEMLVFQDHSEASRATVHDHPPNIAEGSSSEALSSELTYRAKISQPEIMNNQEVDILCCWKCRKYIANSVCLAKCNGKELSEVFFSPLASAFENLEGQIGVLGNTKLIDYPEKD
ncbi:hypothetical protein WISP_106041 [Willisornis vidua]|uniref:Uncharacterized protein n=1 Tax=Willisornis vidua TaxID=1566151 RepID=A0ABQ9CWY6_9PASS|nr:hypothetical protein WISP_106041 [Willisornis vidua]